MNNIKYVVCGLPKTCTTSFMQVFRMLNIKTHDNPICTNYKSILNNNIVWNIDDNLDNSNMEYYDGFHDPPYSLNYKSFYNKYPKSKFILSVRDPEKWFYSLKKYSKQDEDDVFVNVPTKFLKYFFDRDKILEEDKDYIIQKYHEYNNKVIEFFKSKNKEILIINLPENDDVTNWNLIFTYLEIYGSSCKLINEPFPHLNKQ